MADLFWLSDEQWSVVGRFMPTNQPGARRVDDRRVVSGILNVLLRRGKTPSVVEVRAHVRRLVRHIRAGWLKTRIMLRGDGHYARSEAMA